METLHTSHRSGVSNGWVMKTVKPGICLPTWVLGRPPPPSQRDQPASMKRSTSPSLEVSVKCWILTVEHLRSLTHMGLGETVKASPLKEAGVGDDPFPPRRNHHTTIPSGKTRAMRGLTDPRQRR